MAWNDIKVNLEYIKGDARGDVTDRNPDANPLHIDPYREESARAMFVTEVVNNRKLGPLVIQRGGRETFFDEVAALAVAGGTLELEVGVPLAFAYLHLHYHSGRPTSTGRFHDDAIHYRERFKEAVRAFCILAPGLVQSASDPDIVVSQSKTVSVASPMTYT